MTGGTYALNSRELQDSGQASYVGLTTLKISHAKPCRRKVADLIRLQRPRAQQVKRRSVACGVDCYRCIQNEELTQSGRTLRTTEGEATILLAREIRRVERGLLAGADLTEVSFAPLWALAWLYSSEALFHANASTCASMPPFRPWLQPCTGPGCRLENSAITVHCKKTYKGCGAFQS